jgi:hypothetical protein
MEQQQQLIDVKATIMRESAVRKFAKKSNIPQRTLDNKVNSNRTEKLGARQPITSPEQEKDLLANHWFNCHACNTSLYRTFFLIPL